MYNNNYNCEKAKFTVMYNLFCFRHMKVMLMVSKLTSAFCFSVVSLKLTCKHRFNFDNDKYVFKNVLN